MRVPSLKSLSAIPDADHSRMRVILKMGRADLAALPECAEFLWQCHASPRTYQLRLRALDRAARTYGVESVETARGGEWAEYLNAGDMYVPTIIRWRGTYRVQSLGDFIERSRVKFK